MYLGHFITNADLAVDLVNSKGWLTGSERLGTVEALAAFLAAHDLAGPVAPGDLPRVHALRDELHAVFAAGGDEETAQAVNALLTVYPVRPRLRPGGTGAMTFEPTGSSLVERLGATAAIGLATFIADAGASRLGVCDASDCESVYLDVTKNHKRRYCDDSCARLESVRAFRKRRRAIAQPAKSERIER